MKNTIKAFLLILAVLIVPMSASAAYFQSGDQVSLNQSINDDIYVAGGMVTVAAQVSGDAFIAGASINVTNNVSQDLFAAGSSVIITGDVGDDLRVAGSSVVISGTVADDLFAAGSLVQITSDVFGDAHTAGAATIINGTVHGDLLLGSGSAIINGHILGNVTAYADEISIGPNAQIDGVLTYYSESEMDFEGAIIGGIIFEKYTGPQHEIDTDFETPFKALMSFGIIVKIIGLLIAGMILGLAWPKTAAAVTERMTGKFAVSLFVGLIAVVATPIVTILLVVTLIGWPSAVVLIPAAILLTIASSVYVGVVAGSLIVKVIKKEESYRVTWYSILIGVVVATLIVFIPFVGWLIIGLLYLGVLGAILGLVYDLMKKLK